MSSVFRFVLVGSVALYLYKWFSSSPDDDDDHNGSGRPAPDPSAERAAQHPRDSEWSWDRFERERQRRAVEERRAQEHARQQRETAKRERQQEEALRQMRAARRKVLEKAREEAQERENRLEAARTRGKEDALAAIAAGATSPRRRHLRRRSSVSGGDNYAAVTSPPKRPQYNQDEYFKDLREKARKLRNKARTKDQQAERSRVAGQPLTQSRYNMEAQQMRFEAEELDAQGSAWIYTRNNVNNRCGLIDLHDLTVEQACDYTQRALTEALLAGVDALILIVGQGKHSPDGIPKIAPAVQDLLSKQGVNAIQDQTNAGRIFVLLSTLNKE